MNSESLRGKPCSRGKGGQFLNFTIYFSVRSIRRSAVTTLLLLAVCGSVIAQDSGQAIEKWELVPHEDRLTHDKTSRPGTDVTGDRGGRFHLQAACASHTALDLFISTDAGLSPDCEKVRILIDGKLVERGHFQCDQPDGIDRFIFYGDMTEAINQTAGLYGSVFSAIVPDAKSKEVIQDTQKAVQSPNPLTQAANQGAMASLRAAGVAVMSDVVNAQSVKFEMPFAKGGASIIELHPQEPTFKNYVAGCGPAPVPAAREHPASTLGSGPTSGDAINSTLKGPTEKRAARTYRGNLDGFIAALPGYLQRAAAGIGAPERNYSDEISYIAAAAQRCASISPQAAASVTFYGMPPDTSKLGEPYRICSSTFGAGVPGPEGKAPELFLGIHSGGRWGDGKGMTINISYTEVGYPGKSSGTASRDYGIVSAVIGTSDNSAASGPAPSSQTDGRAITLTRARPSRSGQTTITAPGRGQQNYNFVQIDARDFAQGGTLVIDISIAPNSGTDGSFDLFPRSAMLQSAAPAAKSLAGSYDVRRGSQTRLKYRFRSGEVFALNLEGNWFSPKGATGSVQFQASVLK